MARNRSTGAPARRLALCLFLAILVLVADFVTGPRVHFPALYLLPIALAAWGGSPGAGIGLAVAMPLVRLGFVAPWGESWHLWEEAVNAAVNASVLVAFARLVALNAGRKQALEKEVQTLRGLLPICSFCKRIRNAEGRWEPLEQYIGERSEAEFTHGVCPECLQEHYAPYVGRDPDK